MVEFPMTVRPPEPGSFNQPNLSAWLANSIGNLPNQYQQGFENQRKREMANAFPEGAPMKMGPDGKPLLGQDGQPVLDQGAIMKKAFQLGGIEYARPLMQLMLENQFTQETLRGIPTAADPYEGAPGGGGGSGRPGGYPGQRANAPAPNQPPMSSMGEPPPASLNAQTLREMGTELAGGREVTSILENFSRAAGKGLDDPLTPEEALRLQPRLATSITAAQAQPGPQPQGQNPAVASAAPGAIPVQTQTFRPPVSQEASTRPRTNTPGATGPGHFPQKEDLQPRPPQQQQPQPGPGAPGQVAQGTGLPQAGAPVPAAQNIPREMSIPAARNMEKLAQAKLDQAKAVARFNPKMADQLKAEADMWKDRAKQIYDFHAKINEPPPDVKAAASMGMNVLQLKQAEKYGADLMDQSKKKYAGIDAQAAQYERNLKPHLQQLSAIVNDPQFQAGLGSNIALTINKARAMFGDTKAALLQEAFKKITAQSVLAQINDQKFEIEQAGGTGGRIFAQQVDLVTQASPLLENTPAGTRYLGQFAMRMGDISAKVAQMARDYIKQHTRNGIPGVLDPGFDQQVSDYLAKNPIFSEQELSHPEILGAPQAPPRIKTEQELAQWGRSMSLKPGDPVRSPDGKKVTPLPALKAP